MQSLSVPLSSARVSATLCLLPSAREGRLPEQLTKREIAAAVGKVCSHIGWLVRHSWFRKRMRPSSPPNQ